MVSLKQNKKEQTQLNESLLNLDQYLTQDQVYYQCQLLPKCLNYDLIKSQGKLFPQKLLQKSKRIKKIKKLDSQEDISNETVQVVSVKQFNKEGINTQMSNHRNKILISQNYQAEVPMRNSQINKEEIRKELKQAKKWDRRYKDVDLEVEQVLLKQIMGRKAWVDEMVYDLLREYNYQKEQLMKYLIERNE